MKMLSVSFKLAHIHNNQVVERVKTNGYKFNLGGFQTNFVIYRDGENWTVAELDSGINIMSFSGKATREQVALGTKKYLDDFMIDDSELEERKLKIKEVL